jgi:hypothetical protein
MLIKYQKFITPGPNGTTVTVNVVGTELCTIDGWTYFCPSSGVAPTDQDSRIQTSISVVNPDAALKDEIKKASPHCALIKNRRQEAILSAGYDEKDQQAFLHFGVRAAIGPAIGMPLLSDGQAAALTAYAAVCLTADTAAGEAYAALGL